ncbi:MAG TPA: hypothetical protein VEN31_12710 [Candidatus Bathyarchaeia archaeon]|nr:hypothetical protein [Candidatus Bathyarchaeia archaeon]
MKTRLVPLAIFLAVALTFLTLHASAGGETDVSGAGEASFADGATYNGLSLSGSTFGFGVTLAGDGTAVGNLDIALVAHSPLGGEQEIVVVGDVRGGRLNVDGSATFGGMATVDLGDGTLPAGDVPFTLTVTAQGLQLLLGTTQLPAQSLDLGGISID